MLKNVDLDWLAMHFPVCGVTKELQEGYYETKETSDIYVRKKRFCYISPLKL